jgi:chromosomal replication initiator protein
VIVDGRETWRLVLAELEQSMKPANFDTWMRPTRVIGEEDGDLIIGCPSTYVKEWIETRLVPSIKKALNDIGAPSRQLRFRVSDTFPSQRPRTRRAGSAGALGFIGSEAGLNRYTFENFVVGDNNRFAHAAAQRVAEMPGQVYMPLFIYGAVGLGKTHLLHAVGVRCQSYFPSAKVMYATYERFMNDLIKAMRDSTIEDFREQYRSVDMLLIDDIQFISGKEAAQDEFFHTFNTLHASGRQIVIAADRPPKLIVSLEERLLSRFQMGLVADIQPPDLETRIAILRNKAEQQSLPVPPDVIQFIARRAPSNIRELEGSFNRVLAYASFNDTHVSVELATAALDSLDGGRYIQLTPNSIIQAVAGFYRVTPEEMSGKGRDKAIVLPRQVAMYLVREETSSSLENIGRALGGRDHTTVMHGCEKIAEEIQRDHQLRNDIVSIRAALYESAPR